MVLWKKEIGQWKVCWNQYWNMRSLQLNINYDKGGFFEFTLALWKYSFSIYHNED